MKKLLMFVLPLVLSVLPLPIEAEGVSVEGTQRHYDSLRSALVEAAGGETLLLEPGSYRGNFVIDRTLTLKSVDPSHPAVLDGEGKGSVVTIRARDVRLEDLVIRNSGATATYRSMWGDSGVLVRADGAVLRGVRIVENDWGITLLGVQGATVIGSTIRDNRIDGIYVMGGSRHRIADNVISGNQSGIVIADFYTEEREWRMFGSNDREAQKRYSRQRSHTNKAHDMKIERNLISGNGNIGIELDWYVHHIEIVGNRIEKTGKIRKPDYRNAEKFLTELQSVVGADLPQIVGEHLRFLGSGIHMTCMGHHDRIEGNLIADNHSYGIDISLCHHVMIRKNRILGNHDGIYLTNGAADNEVTENLIERNGQCGIGINSYDREEKKATGNLIHRNDLRDNPFNAYDAAGREPTQEELMRFVENAPWPESLKEKIESDPALKRQVLENQRKHLKAGHNRWDDGSRGNHYGNFDEATEGFVDRNGDGIGERPYPIPGGNSVDRFPLDAGSVADLEEKVPAAGYRP